MTANDWVAIGKILGVGLLAGAGLPALFTVGLRLITPAGAPGPAATPVATRVRPASFSAGLLCFALVAVAIGYGIYLIVRG